MTTLTNTANKVEFSGKFVAKVLILVQKAPNLGRLRKDRKKLKILKLIVEILKA